MLIGAALNLNKCHNHEMREKIVDGEFPRHVDLIEVSEILRYELMVPFKSFQNKKS